MCRLLHVRCASAFPVRAHLEPFAELSRNSKEFQGHGWGCAFLDGGRWRVYHDIRPVWEDDLARFGQTQVLVAHARSACKDRDIRVQNNMPFHDGRYVFAFNGELRGVKIRERGRIGAEKIFNYVKRFDRGDMFVALERAGRIIEQRTAYLRAMNILIADEGQAWISTRFNEDPDYFTLHEKRADGLLALCSEPYPGERDWLPIPNGTVRRYACT